jgi:acetoin utilization deacetylase AcuC-like enzyme
MPTGLIYSEKFLEHDTGPRHPERPQRLAAIVERLKAAHLWNDLVHLPFAPAGVNDIAAVHDADYIKRVEAACQAGERSIDTPDSAICPLSYDVARLAVGGALAACDAVMAGKITNAFCAIRPPGHHAEHAVSMGFCLFDTAAVAAQYLIAHHHLARIAIVDFDVHHGNGTQHLFERRADVFFISLHEHPRQQYPGTGFEHERGKENGEGYTLNIPLPTGSGDDEYRHAFRTQVVPALDKFDPQFLLISAGFDACVDDPLGGMHVTPECFRWMTAQLKAVAERHCKGRLVSLLEGGYNLDRLAECVALHVGALMQEGGVMN